MLPQPCGVRAEGGVRRRSGATGACIAGHRERHRTRYRLWFAFVTSERNASSGLGPRGIIPRGLPGEVWRGGGGGRGGTISGQSTVFDGGG